MGDDMKMKLKEVGWVTGIGSIWHWTGTRVCLLQTEKRYFVFNKNAGMFLIS
jgi:hypothetical protein